MKWMRKIAAVLAVSLLLPIFASCNKKANLQDSIIVSKDDVWYDSTRFNVIPPEAGFDYKMAMKSYRLSNDRLYITYQKTNADMYWDVTTLLQIYDLDGSSKIIEIDYPEEGEDLILRPEVLVPNEDGKTGTIIVEKSNVGIMDWKYYTSQIDLETGKASELKQVDIDGNNYSILEVRPAGKYTCFYTSKINSNDPYVYFFYEGNELLQKVETEDIIEGAEYSFMLLDDFIPIPDSDQIIGKFYTGGSLLNCRLDPKAGTISDVKIMTQNEYFEQLGSGDKKIDESSFCATVEGDLMNVGTLGDISLYDPDSGNIETVIDRNEYSPFFSDYSFTDLTTAEVLSHNDKRTILIFKTVDPITSEETVKVTVLQKMSVNPHAGKKVMEIESPESCSAYLSTAIYTFNETDPDYLIRVWNKHNLFNNVQNNVSDQLPYVQSSYACYAGLPIKGVKLDDMIAEELASGDEAPDLILNLRNERTMSEELLLDLSESLDPDVKAKVYGNIVDACKYNDKLYFMPVNVFVDGIVCLEDDLDSIDAGKTGFTFETYDSFVKGPNNGQDPYYYECLDEINGGVIRYAFIESCIDTYSATQGDKVDFDTEQFRTALKYYFEEYPVQAVKFDDLESEYEPIPQPNGNFRRLSSYIDYIDLCKKGKKNYVVMGTPSIEEHGPRFRVSESVSVFAHSDVQDGAKRFLNHLIGGSFKNDQDLFEDICINKEVLEYEFPMLTKKNNRRYSYLINDGWPAQYIDVNIATETTENNFLDTMSKVSIYSPEDPDIRTILEEELFTYGNKDIDEIIDIINDRVSKVVAEKR